MVMHSGDLKRSPLCIYSPHFIRKIPSYYINRENSAMQMYNRGIQMYRFPNSDVQKSVIFEGIKKRLKIV